MESCRAVENEFDKAVKKLSINTVGIEKIISKLTVFRDELKNSEFSNINFVGFLYGPILWIRSGVAIDSTIYGATMICFPHTYSG